MIQVIKERLQFINTKTGVVIRTFSTVYENGMIVAFYGFEIFEDGHSEISRFTIEELSVGYTSQPLKE